MQSVSSSLVSFSSKSSIDSKLKLSNSAYKYIIENGSNEHGGLFWVASGSSSSSGGGCFNGTSGGDTPQNWVAATVASTKERGGENKHSFRALVTLMHGGDNSNNGTVSKIGSLDSINTG